MMNADSVPGVCQPSDHAIRHGL